MLPARASGRRQRKPCYHRAASGCCCWTSWRRQRKGSTATEPVDGGAFTLEVLAHAGNGARGVPDRTARRRFLSLPSRPSALVRLMGMGRGRKKRKCKEKKKKWKPRRAAAVVDSPSPAWRRPRAHGDFLSAAASERETEEGEMAQVGRGASSSLVAGEPPGHARGWEVQPPRRRLEHREARDGANDLGLGLQRGRRFSRRFIPTESEGPPSIASDGQERATSARGGRVRATFGRPRG
jgi:hypothetical protein